MKLRVKLILLIIAVNLPLLVFSQQLEEPSKWQINGYLKEMVTIIKSDSVLVDNLIHHRLNLEWTPNEHFSVNLGMRNRIFTGDLVQAIPGYSSFVDTNNDYFDFSWNSVDRKKVVVNSVFDRAYIEWRNDEWEIRAGRQRVNWGTNVVWNPNDLFNAYSFFDFDYEERPGSDAIRVTRYFGFASSLEIAATYADNMDDMVAAAMWKFNKKGYDVQLISGIAQGDFTAGIGWAGNVGLAGFKGEITYFTPYEQRVGGETSIAGSVGLDYSFSNSFYLMGSYLYNSNAFGQLNLLGGGNMLSAKNLMPYEHSIFLQGSYPIHPLVNLGVGTMAFPGENSYFVNPSVSVSIVDNLDLGIFSQIILDDPNGTLESTLKMFFARLKWSF